MKLLKMIEMYLKYDNMHTNRIFTVFICTNNHVNSCTNYILSVDDNKFVDEWAQDLIHQPLKCVGRVRETEQHNSPLVETVLYHKGALPLISRTNQNLMVSASQINI